MLQDAVLEEEQAKMISKAAFFENETAKAEARRNFEVIRNVTSNSILHSSVTSDSQIPCDKYALLRGPPL